MDTGLLILIVIASLFCVGVIGLRVGYDEGYAQALEDRGFYDDVARNFWAKLEEEE